MIYFEDRSPDDYFERSRLLTLDDCKEYEEFLKSKLIEWSGEYPDRFKKYLIHLKLKG